MGLCLFLLFKVSKRGVSPSYFYSPSPFQGEGDKGGEVNDPTSDEVLFLQPGHHLAQFGTDLLNEVFGIPALQGIIDRAASLVF